MAATDGGGGEAAGDAAAAGLQAAGLQLQAEGVEDLPVEAVVKALQLQVRYLVITLEGAGGAAATGAAPDTNPPRIPWFHLASPQLASPHLTSPRLALPQPQFQPCQERLAAPLRAVLDPMPLYVFNSDEDRRTLQRQLAAQVSKRMSST